MVFRHSLLGIDHHQHRPLPLLFPTHPLRPLRPPLRTQTNYTRVKFRHSSTTFFSERAIKAQCYVFMSSSSGHFFSAARARGARML
jgi:hypothetical protein